MNATVAAIATGPGNGGIGVIRISGPDADSVLARVARRESARFPPRSLVRARVYDPDTGAVVDDGLAVRFPGPGSYTGEDTVELQVHGGTVALRACLSAVLRCGAVAAEPGEFTERAFRNGRIDLAQAEAVAAMISAGSEAALRVARRQLDGELTAALRHAGDPLRAALAAIEAAIDYPEEIGNPDPRELAEHFLESVKRVDALLAGAALGARLERGATVVLAGVPNVGKSSLLNRLAGREHAIVTDIPGTTRDPIEVDLAVDGIPVRFVDTAGLRSTDDPVESQGVERSRRRAGDADIVVVVLDATGPCWPDGLDPEDPRLMVVLNKIDLTDSAHRDPEWIPASTVAPGGLDRFLAALGHRLAGSVPDETVLATKVRHVQALRSTRECCRRASEGALARVPIDCIAVDGHAALTHLSSITGGDGREETLREIFSRFCLGK
ncbi:MAG: tRNA uridine-5-carboxymethylaminomethyl(34) synthesis GTPase MnmE [Armatimonadota bacterium]